MPSPKADWDNAHVGVQGPPIATTMNDSVPAADSPFRPLVPEDFRRRGNGRSNSSGDWTALTGRPSASSPRTTPAAATAACPRQKPGSGPGRAQEKNNEPAAAAGLHNTTREDQTTPRASSFSEAAAAAQQWQKNQQTQSRAVGTSVTSRSAKNNKGMDKTPDVKQSPSLVAKPELPPSAQSIALRDEAERDWQAYWQRQRAQIATHGRRAPPETVQAALRSASKPPSSSLGTDGQRGGGDTQHQSLSSSSAGSQRQQMQRQKPPLKRHSSDNLTGKACIGLFDDQRYDHKRKPMSADVMQEALLGMMNIVETGPKSPQESLSLGKGMFVDSSERFKLPFTHDSSISGADDAASSSMNGSSIELLEESRPVARAGGKGLSGRRMFRSRSVYVGVGDGSSSNGSSSSASAGTLLPRPEMRNDLTSEERREQLRRAQKLASLLGGEVLASSDGEDAGREALRHKRSSPRIPGLPRRQSDPFDVLMHRSVIASSPSSREESRYSIHASKAGPREDETAPGPTTSTLRARRSRSALGLVGRERSSSISSPLAPTQPPLDIHPKAAAILGLPHSKGLFAFRPSVTTPPASTNGDDDNEIHAKGQNSATSDSVASWVTSQLDQDHEADQDKDDVGATTLPSSRDSIEMLESDDDAVAEDQEEQGLSLRQGSRVLGEAIQRKTFDSTLLTSSSPAWIREERRKRVTKITRWLGDVVPAHLVTHSSEPQRTPPPAYFFDEMPPSALVDFASGTPLISRSSSSSSSAQKNNHDATESSSPIRPIAKAKAAVNAKLSKSRNGPRAPLLLDTSHKNLSSPQFANVPKSAPPTVDDAHRLTAKEHSDQVRRASKLTSLFGEVPPQPLFAPTQSTEAVKLSTLGITSKHHRSTPSLVRPPFDGAPSLDQMRPARSHRPRSTSPMSQDGKAMTGYSRLGERPKSTSDSLQPPPADDGLSSEHYRYSIGECGPSSSVAVRKEQDT
ncbi:hypothetical protein FA10DRAFT_81499 [Acaromyces ingoldii]|uniref:Uncharacterized protein n=1 Tax=Acaromyces ingoldii TaxID=215250 RepID=A0A316YRN0_9BASI|nr:hypothetical protein FA10DRAFT_81499 [Acaromyces ingoldii]PWN92037.1 hypothetical protein FA10DRAFT_81499 [Acaromyces ingoldii]